MALFDVPRGLPGELEGYARECDAKASELEGVVASLNGRSTAVFSSFQGTAAESYKTLLLEHMALVNAARQKLHEAADALRRDAVGVRDAISQADEEERRQNQDKP